MIKLFIAILLSLISIFLALYLDFLPAVFRFFLAVFGLFISSKLIGNELKIKDEFGFLLLKSKSGLEIVENLAKKYEKVFILLADSGMVLAYGLFGLLQVKGPLIRKIKIGIFGFLIFFLLIFAVSPYVFPVILTTLGKSINAEKIESSDGVFLFFIILMVVGGLALMAFLSLVGYAVNILFNFVKKFFGLYNEKIEAGATLILPGINIPFFEGIIALFIILLVHEGAHAILSIIGKIKINSSGIVLFGILPVGAFVEPDEKELFGKSKEIQNRIIVAGSAFNLYASLVFFGIFLVFNLLSADLKESGILVVNGEHKGEIIYRIEGEEPISYLNKIKNKTDISEIRVLATTKSGEKIIEIKRGEFAFIKLEKNSIIAKYKHSILDFIYLTLALTFSLNFVIGIVNLLPIPLFDGFRLLELSISSKLIVTMVASIAGISFVINLLPAII